MVSTPSTRTLRDADGLAFHASAWESGRPSAVLLVHGLLGTRKMAEIATVAEALAERHDVLAIDVRGHGTSPGRFTWGREEWKQVAAASESLAAAGRSVAAVGFSFGGFHAVRATARGAPLRRLVLIGAPADLRVFDHFPFGPKLWRHFPAMIGRGRRRLHAEGPRFGARGAIGDDELAAVSVPALVIHGGDDWLVTPRHADRYASGLPFAKRVDVPGGFHGEYMVHSHGEGLIDLIRSFLAADSNEGVR